MINLKDTKRISTLQIGVITFFLTKAAFFPIASSILLKLSKQNIGISIIVGALIGLIPLFIYLSINTYDKNKNIIELNVDIFGKILGNIINFIIVLGIITIGSIMILGLCNFVFSNFLTQVPIVLISALFLLIVCYAALKGIETISRTSQILFLFGITLFTLGFFSLLYYVDVNNFKPFFEITFNKVISSSYSFVLFGITPIFMLSIIPNKVIIRNEHYKKSVLIGYIISVIVILLTLLSTTGVLGNISTIFEYPEYIAFKQIEYFHFFERVENILSIQWIFDIFIFMVMIIYFLKKYISSTFSIKKEKVNNFITILFGILLFLISSIFFTNSVTIKNLIIKNYSIVTIISFLVIPLIIFIRIKTHHKR